MAEKYRVLRTFVGAEGRRYMPGEEVDGSGWRNASKLMNQGRIIPTVETPPPAPERKERRHGE